MRVLRHMLLLALLAAGSAISVQMIRTNIRPLDDPGATAAGMPVDLAPAAGLPADPAPEPPDLARFSDAFERPLFAEDRRPRLKPILDAPEDRSLGVTLLGILYSRAERVAVLAPAGGAGSLRLAEGENYRGWRLVEVRPNSVIFQQDDETVELRLLYKGPKLSIDPDSRIQ
jgi:general secretion pathway protein N